MKKRSVICTLTALALMGTLLTACGGSSGSSSPAPSGSDGEDGPIQVRVACMPAYEPFNITQTDGTVDGYDIAIVRAIDERADEIECVYQTAEWSSLFAGLDSDYWDMLAAQVGYTAERDEMYEYGPTYCAGSQKFIVTERHADWAGIEDVTGKVAITAGTFQANLLEDYLAEHPGQFEIVYYEGTLENFLIEIREGRVDTTLEDVACVNNKCEILGYDDLMAVGDDVFVPCANFLFQDTDEGKELNAIFTKYLEEIIADGTLSEISEEYLGFDCLPLMQGEGYWTNVG